MKHLHKFASVLLALAMALSLMVPAFAAENTKAEITIENPVTGHTYSVYQIFTGTLSEDGKTLSNVVWGVHGKNLASAEAAAEVGKPVPQDVLDALVAATSDADTKELDVIEQYLDTTAAEPIAKLNSETNSTGDIATGYYLIKDEGPAGEGDSISLNVVQLVGDIAVKLKTSDTTLVKKVQDTNDSDSTVDADGNWKDSADYDIGDEVPFQLTATLGDGIDDYYETYMVQFNDTLSKGLTLNKGTIKVTIDGVEKTDSFTVSELTTNADDGSNSFTVTCDDVKVIGAKNNSKIVLTYTATLNDDAVIGGTGNSNEATLKYTNNPNNTGDGTHTPGETPKDKVVVFTFEGVVDKVRANPNFDSTQEESDSNPKYLPLEGAGFTLYKKVNNDWVAIGEEIKGGDTTQFVWKGLDDGDYKLEETTTPDGFNTIAPIEFTISATHDEESADPKLTELKAVVTSGGDVEINGDETDGTLSTTIENKSGATLPETGGIGTTIFYTVGGILVAGAVILLVTKKRMSAEK